LGNDERMGSVFIKAFVTCLNHEVYIWPSSNAHKE
jgi:hypothetical protein